VPELTIPLIGQPTQRGLATAAAFTAGQDQRFINCLFQEVIDQQSQQKIVYVQKRQGLETFSTPASGQTGNDIFVSPAQNQMASVFSSGSVYSLYWGTTNCGDIQAGIQPQINEAIIGSISYLIFTTTAGDGWYLPSDAVSGFTFTGDTHTNTTIDNVSSLTGLYVGQKISGTGIQSGTRIATITAPSTITTTLATTATNAGVTITREGVAKMINANFPASARGIVQMDGYLFVGDPTNNRVYNGNLNSISTFSSGDYIPSDTYSDTLSFVGRYKTRILGFGVTNIEKYYNNGNPSNSVLNSAKEEAALVGASVGLAQIGDYLFFIGSPNLHPGIWMMSGDGVRKISTPVIDRVLSSGLFASKISAFSYGGYSFLMFQSVTNRVFFYCIDINSWNEQDFTSAVTAVNSVRNVSNLGGPFFIGSSSGKVYVWDASPVYTDDGSAYTMTIQTDPKFINGGKPFIIDWIDVICDTQASGSSTVLASGDDYATFDTLGTIDLTSQLKRIQPGGRYESSVAFKLTDAGNQAWRGQALKVHWTPCQ
jgi:hypothetical protein